LERRYVGDQVVGSHDQKDRVVFDRQQRGQSQSGGGATAYRFKHDERLRNPGLQKLAGHHEAVLLIGDHDRPGGDGTGAEAAQAQDGLLEEGARTGEGQQLLGMTPARDRPQPGAGASGEYDGLDGRGHDAPFCRACRAAAEMPALPAF